MLEALSSFGFDLDSHVALTVGHDQHAQIYCCFARTSASRQSRFCPTRSSGRKHNWKPFEMNRITFRTVAPWTMVGNHGQPDEG